ncbi:hypothetical protein GPZ77_34535 (plasmid) [Streptomyces sp. QHH-9511]|uniref:hypothetical protein n=1 Tax=Streptomyces sp. QHH-9511 TaxID=2684468 RepID=UPI0013165BF2|nr:hypothetical protein [Streptomyces sp. QHH-9511]QGZ53350.1 hypothetical protein GPZ77_34535 [Streptomyces sp. QHH-9511]
MGERPVQKRPRPRRAPPTPRPRPPQAAEVPRPDKPSSTSTSSKRDAGLDKPKKTDSSTPGKDRSRTGNGPATGGPDTSSTTRKASSGSATLAKDGKTPAPKDKPAKQEKVSLTKRAKKPSPTGPAPTPAGTAPKDPKTTKAQDGPSAKKPTPNTDTTKPKKDGPDPANGPHADTKKPDATKGTGTTAKDPKPTSNKRIEGHDGTAPAGKPLGTRTSRETGYRDGTRAARAAAHVQAYRDGVKDGWADTQEAAQREKTALDTAHAARKQQRDKEPAVPPTPAAPPKPTRAPATPITVTGIDATSVHLGDGATRTSLTRGEVRTLKGFERRLEDKQRTMQTIAEQTKGLEAHAARQAEKVTQLLEAAKGVKGGEKLVATLVKLEEAAKTQTAQATEITKRAVRAADATAAVHTNARTRYGAIYQAVVDSDETKPAELHFYKG